ncbi:MAG: hypothetical protein ACUVQ2_05420 [Dissulfurimicrobium sp.]|uniref:hypothetical protein n=1 Tax=Dissulfurimicrobium sp. TaxID=2022436 RepID=UPI00404B5B81
MCPERRFAGDRKDTMVLTLNLAITSFVKRETASVKADRTPLISKGIEKVSGRMDGFDPYLPGVFKHPEGGDQNSDGREAFGTFHDPAIQPLVIS